MEHLEKNLEVEIRLMNNKVVITGSTDKVLDVYRSLFALKYPNKTEAEAGHEVDEARAHVEGTSDYDYQYTFGVNERVTIRNDRFGEYGRLGTTLMLYMPNSPVTGEEEERTAASIKQNMLKLGYKI